MDASRRVVRTYYALTALFTLSGALIWGVNTLVMLDAGLTLVGAFAANAAFTAAQVVFEIPTGVVADTRGRRFSFLLAMATLVIASAIIVALSLTQATLPWWLAANVLLGLGFALYSGATEAWFVDAFNATGGPIDELDAHFARGAQLFGVGTLVGALSGGLLGSVDLSLPWAMRAIMLGVLFLVGWRFMRDEGFTTRSFKFNKIPEEVGAVARASWRHGWMNPAVRWLMVLSFLQMGFLIWGWYAWQPYFLQLLGKDLVWVAGVIAALVSIMMIVGNQVVRMLGKRVARETVIVVSSTGLALAMVGVGLAGAFVPAVAAFLVGMLFFGTLGPAKQGAFHRLIPSGQRATIVSFDGLLASAGGVGSQIALARIAQAFGYDVGYLVGAGFLVLAIPVALLFASRARSLPIVTDPAR